jgi:hypothetical protein
MKTGATRAGLGASQPDQPTSDFAEKSTNIILTVIKRLHGLAALAQLTDGD